MTCIKIVNYQLYFYRRHTLVTQGALLPKKSLCCVPKDSCLTRDIESTMFIGLESTTKIDSIRIE